MGRRKKVDLPHNVKERYRHQNLQKMLEHVADYVPKPPSFKKETKAKKLRRVVLYMKYLLLKKKEFSINPKSVHRRKKVRKVDANNSTAVSSEVQPVSAEVNTRKAQIVFLRKSADKEEKDSKSSDSSTLTEISECSCNNYTIGSRNEDYSNTDKVAPSISGDKSEKEPSGYTVCKRRNPYETYANFIPVERIHTPILNSHIDKNKGKTNVFVGNYSNNGVFPDKIDVEKGKRLTSREKDFTDIVVTPENRAIRPEKCATLGEVSTKPCQEHLGYSPPENVFKTSNYNRIREPFLSGTKNTFLDPEGIQRRHLYDIYDPRLVDLPYTMPNPSSNSAVLSQYPDNTLVEFFSSGESAPFTSSSECVSSNETESNGYRRGRTYDSPESSGRSARNPLLQTYDEESLDGSAGYPPMHCDTYCDPQETFCDMKPYIDYGGKGNLPNFPMHLMSNVSNKKSNFAPPLLDKHVSKCNFALVQDDYPNNFEDVTNTSLHLSPAAIFNSHSNSPQYYNPARDGPERCDESESFFKDGDLFVPHDNYELNVYDAHQDEDRSKFSQMDRCGSHLGLKIKQEEPEPSLLAEEISFSLNNLDSNSYLYSDKYF